MKKRNTTDLAEVSGNLMRLLVSGYVLALFAVLPLLYHDRYYDMGEFKFALYERLTWILAAGVGIIGLVIMVSYCMKEWRVGRLAAVIRALPGKFILTDWFALGYAVSVLISYILSSYQTDALKGYKGWYMGTLSQLSFVLLYLLASRYWIKNLRNHFLWVAGISSAITFLLAVLHRFRIDPLAMYEGLQDYYYIQFLTTVGQATWYSGFLCTVFPIGLILFWHCNQRWQRICLGIYCMIGYASLVTQNSDSAFAALATVWVVLFFLSLDSTKDFRRLLEVIILGLGTMRVVGLLQMAFPDRAVSLDTLSLFWSQHVSLWIILAALIMLYILLMYQEDRHGFEIASVSWIRDMAAWLVVICLVLGIGLMILTTKGGLPDFLAGLYEVPYLVWNHSWGNQRGFTWSLSMEMFMEYPLKEKLIGVGSDCYALYLYDHYQSEVAPVFGQSVLANAHNEWMNMLLNQGLFGLTTYLGFFIGALTRLLRGNDRNIMTTAVEACIFSYMIHNFFCYQQVMCTPLIFILAGMGVRYLAVDKN